MIKRYFSLYKKFVATNIALMTTYRTIFYYNVLSSLLWGSFHFITMLLLTSQIESINGWSRVDLLVLTGAYSILWGLFHIFFTHNFERMSDTIFYGQLDSLLLKPADSQFLLSFWYINFPGLVRSAMGVLFIVYLTFQYHLQFQLINIISFVAILIFSLALIYSIWYLLATLLIWSPRLSNIIDFLYYVSGILRYPADMYRPLNGVLFFFLIPLLIVITTPVKTLLNNIGYNEILLLITLSIFFVLLSRFFWKFALRSYTSASG